MNTTVFTQQVEAMSNRLTNLYQGIDTSSSLTPALLLPSALKELGIASEQLEVAAQMLHQQNRKFRFQKLKCGKFKPKWYYVRLKTGTQIES